MSVIKGLSLLPQRSSYSILPSRNEVIPGGRQSRLQMEMGRVRGGKYLDARFQRVVV
jgi:hypothetical protein